MMKTVLCLGFLTTLLAMVQGWSKFLDTDYNDAWQPARRSFGGDSSDSGCTGSGGKCYASGQCCKGYVCAAFDDLFGLNPEIPGYCVREKDLNRCQTSAECGRDAKCVKLGHTGIRYCVPRPDEPQKTQPDFSKDKVGLGSSCDDSDDCATYTIDGKDRLCCQEVRRYRQKAKKICDRVTAISTCLPAGK